MKRILLIGMCLISMTQLFAQRKVNPGIRAGWNSSTVSDLNGDYRSNFYIGLQLPISLAKFYTLQPEINYTRQGVNNVSNVVGYYNNHYMYESSNLTLDYIDVNVINKFHFNRLNLQVGPGLAFLTNSSISGVTKIDLTLNLGVGIDITSRLGIEARWKPGLVDIDENYYTAWDTNTVYSYNSYYRNNVFQIGGYFKF